MQPHKILVIEDDDFLRNLAYTKLTSVGFSVDISSEGISGMTRIQTGVYDLIILDLLLPNMDGFHILADLHKHGTLNPDKFIVFSNLGTKEDIESIRNYGIKNYMIKSSFTLDELVIRINSILGSQNGNEIATSIETPNNIEFTAHDEDRSAIPHSPVA